MPSGRGVKRASTHYDKHGYNWLVLIVSTGHVLAVVLSDIDKVVKDNINKIVWTMPRMTEGKLPIVEGIGKTPLAMIP